MSRGLTPDTTPDKVGGLLHAVDVFADPVERVEIAQAPLAVLDVGLDDVARVAHPPVALVALGELGGDEFGGGAGDDLGPETLHRLVENRLLAPDQPRFEKGGADGHVGFRQRHQVGNRADRMADLDLEVPQQMQDRLNDGFLSRRRLGRGEKHQVEIAVRCHLAPASSAEPDDGHGFGRLVRGDKVVGQPDQLVVQIGRCSRRRPSTIRIERQSPRNFGTPLFERAPQDLRREPVPVLPLG